MCRCCKCCSCRVASNVAAVLVALVAGLCYKASLDVQRLCEQMPQAEELPPSAKYFHPRPSDGGRLEWHEYGSTSASARVWLLIHGAVSTGGMFHIFPNFDRRMKEMDVRVIAPTMPGWGASDAYEPVFQLTGGELMRRWALDSVALLDSLGVDKFAVSGMSLGGPPGLATAEAAQRQGRLVALAPLIANMWHHAEFDPLDHGNYSLPALCAVHALTNQYLGSAAAQLMRRMILGTSDFSANPMVPADVMWDRGLWGSDMQRSIRYQLVGQVQSNRMAFIHSPGQFVDWSVFSSSVPVYVFFGERDEVCVPSMATFTATKLPWARLMPFNGTHFHLDIFLVASTLFGASAP